MWPNIWIKPMVFRDTIVALESVMINRYTINTSTNLEKEGGMCA